MRTKTIRLVIIIFLLLPLITVLIQYFGPPSYRLRERNQAFNAFESHPSPVTKAALSDELMQLEHHRNMIAFSIICSLLFVDAVVIYLFWNYGTKKQVAATALDSN